MPPRLPVLLLGVALVAATVHAAWVGAGHTEVPLDGNGTQWLVRASVDRRVDGRFLLDTGASVCVVSPDFARRLAVTPSGSADLQTANGVVRAPIVTLRSFAIGSKTARELQAVVHPSIGDTVDGIVGLNFLNQFHYAIDPRRKVLRLE